MAAEVRPVTDLATLAAKINTECEVGDLTTRRGLEHFRQAGHWLNEAKDRIGHGQWLNWLEENCPKLNERCARRYMKLAKTDSVSDLTLEWKRITGRAPHAKNARHGSEKYVQLLDKAHARLMGELGRLRAVLSGPAAAPEQADAACQSATAMMTVLQSRHAEALKILASILQQAKTIIRGKPEQQRGLFDDVSTVESSESEAKRIPDAPPEIDTLQADQATFTSGPPSDIPTSSPELEHFTFACSG
jgi:hypothetical protein